MEKKPLRIGILVESLTLPRWIRKVIEDIHCSRAASLVVVASNASVGNQSQPTVPALYRLYDRIEDVFFPVGNDAFELVSITDLLTNCDVLDIMPLGSGSSDDFDDAIFHRLLAFKLDVLLKFGFRPFRSNTMRLAQYGVWECVHGCDATHQTAPGFWEVFRQEPCTTARLKMLGSGEDKERIIDHCHGYTDKHSVKRNRHYNAWRSSQFVPRCLERLQAHGIEALQAHSSDDAQIPGDDPSNTFPTNGAMTFLLAGHVGRYLKKKVYDAFYQSQWAVGFKLGTDTNSLFSAPHGFTVIEPPQDRFWADPFVVRSQDSYFIFLEELLYSTNKGHLCVSEVDTSGRVGKMTRILEKDYHLSYPFMFGYAGHMYMLPETSENETIEVYRATCFPYEWTLHTVMMEGVNAVDTTLVEIDSIWWMFTTIGVKNAPPEEDLHIFYSDSPFGPWKPHKKNPVISDCRRGRQAGRIFQHHESFYRPAQESTLHRGYGLSINRITRITSNDYCEEQVSRILPRQGGRIRGMHTLNHESGMTVLDINLKTRRSFGLCQTRQMKSITLDTSPQLGVLYTPESVNA